MNRLSSRVSPYKIFFHRDRLDKYLQGEIVYPLLLDLDLTNRCPMTCPNCYTKTRDKKIDADFEKIKKLFFGLKGKTCGLAISGGGEPLFYPRFNEVLRLARQEGFKEIFVITGGLGLRMKGVIEGLLQYATAIRVSLNTVNQKLYQEIYGRDVCEVVKEDIRTLVALRNKGKSDLEIGIGILTNPLVAKGIADVGRFAEEVGIDWIQVRPAIADFEKGKLKILHDFLVEKNLRSLRSVVKKVKVIRSLDRYHKKPCEISFSRYHAAHFIMPVAVDGTVWLGIECKEDNEFTLGNIYKSTIKKFLGSKKRLEIINKTNSQNYPKLGAMTRSILMDDLIEKIIKGKQAITETIKIEHPWLL